MRYEVEHLLASGNELGEGPLWRVDEGRLYWVDIVAGNIHRVRPGETDYETFSIGMPIGSMGVRARGGFILALKHGIHFWEPATNALTFLGDPEADLPHARFNDGKVDRKGRFWAGTMDNHGQSALYRVDPDGSIRRMQDGVTCSNGLGWSPDNRTMYYSDSQIFTVYAYDFDLESGEIANRRVFLHRDVDEPDGLTVDAEGCVWIAHWNGWALERFDPDGTSMVRIPMPVQYPTCPTFGGPAMDELYVTSAWFLLGRDGRGSQPMAGDLFRIRAGVTGIPEPAFAG